ncbi:hypothetical protein [Cytobacillus sp. IB215665]|uniref:hypothetical protein n=1 Tax=Cytobacillus sp. IB215665 TaxID=3097357 RepID=UPI002A0B87D3|nr:hypothetical protein [Cytobacillus sp. IB215665]MDX8365449.1 hypothetical protein [Cytobacillus sp. IB215665]
MDKDIFDLDLQINKGSTKTLAGDTEECLSFYSGCGCSIMVCPSNDCETNDCTTRFSICGCGTSDIC